MGWVNDALKELAESGHCKIRPHGGSMRGRIESGQLVTIEKVEPSDVLVNDVALVKWNGNYLLHIIIEIREEKASIGNNLGKINGWIPLTDVIGKVTKVEE